MAVSQERNYRVIAGLTVPAHIYKIFKTEGGSVIQ